MIFLHKILSILLSPIFLVGLLAAIGAVRKSQRLVFVAVGLLYLLSTPIAANLLIRAVERPYQPIEASKIPNADAIVVLSGMLLNVEMPSGEVSHEWGDPDRFFGGLELLRLNKAPKLVWTGGRLPWDTHKLSEGELLMQEAIKLGFSRERFLLTSDVQNTADEAKAVAKLLGPEKSIVLVTSAFHMPRSRALFEAQGLVVVPYAVDFKVSAGTTTPMDFLPEANALHRSSIAFREMLGRLYYAVRSG